MGDDYHPFVNPNDLIAINLVSDTHISTSGRRISRHMGDDYHPFVNLNDLIAMNLVSDTHIFPWQANIMSPELPW